MENNWENKIIEKLADIEHKRWVDWQKYMHSKCFTAEHNENGLVCWCNPKIEVMKNANNIVVHNDCLIIPEWAVKNWERQIKTDYKDLNEKEKESDRKQVMRYFPIVIELLKQQEDDFEKILQQKEEHYKLREELVINQVVKDTKLNIIAEIKKEIKKAEDMEGEYQDATPAIYAVKVYQKVIEMIKNI